MLKYQFAHIPMWTYTQSQYTLSLVLIGKKPSLQTNSFKMTNKVNLISVDHKPASTCLWACKRPASALIQALLGLVLSHWAAKNVESLFKK